MHFLLCLLYHGKLDKYDTTQKKNTIFLSQLAVVFMV